MGSKRSPSLLVSEPLVEEFYLRQHDSGSSADGKYLKHYCCKKHEYLVVTKAISTHTLLARKIKLFLDVMLSQTPSFEIGYISREALFCSGIRALRGSDNDLPAVSPSVLQNLLKNILDDSLLDLSSQRRQLLWSQYDEAAGDASRCAALPVVWYDRQKFCMLVVALLEKLHNCQREQT
jgi:hypothetical protein